MSYLLAFDIIILKQLKKLESKQDLKFLLQKLFDRLEEEGPEIGKLLDSQTFLYEMKVIRPPLRLYYTFIQEENEIHLFELQMKTSKKKQKELIKKLILKRRRFRSLSLYVCTFSPLYSP